MSFTLPKGFVFQLNDEVLLSYYLERKNQRKDPHITAVIPEIDVCEHEPRDLPALVSGNSEWFAMVDSPDQWYFYSPVVFKDSKSSQIKRSTKEGSWKQQGNDKKITEACSGKQIGGKRIFTHYLPNKQKTDCFLKKKNKKQKTDWVRHEYFLTKPGSNEQIGDFVLCFLKNNSGSRAHDPPLCNGGKASSGSCSMASHVEKQASGELGNVVVTRCGNDDEAEHDGSISSMATDVENQALGNVFPVPNGNEAEHGGSSCNITTGFEKETAEYGMLTKAEEEEFQTFKELEDAVWESVVNKRELERTQIDPGNLLISEEDQPDSCKSFDPGMVEELLDELGDLNSLPHRSSSQLQSPIYTKRGTINAQNDEIRKRKYPFGDSDPSFTKKNHIDEADSNTASDSESQAADAIPDGYSHPRETLGSDSFHSQEPLSINREPRDFPHDNNDIDWDQLASFLDGFDFSQFSHPVIDGGNSDRNSKVANPPVNDYSSLAIGANAPM